MQPKRSKDRSRFWLNNGFWAILLLSLATGFFWYFQREPAAIPLRYGELKQVLQDPSVTITNLRVGRSEIRGQIQTRDPLIDGGSGEQHARDEVVSRRCILAARLVGAGAWRSQVAHSLGVRVVGRSNRLAPTTTCGN